jgi:shikimate kinase
MNAMATGEGAALGVNLWTKARVTLTDQAGSFSGRNLSEPNEDVSLIETTARKVLERYNAHRRFGALIETESIIPMAAGLKSSSAASNAVALAAVKALKKKSRPLETINVAVDASLEANVTLTGAFDDACACYYGGLIVTNNTQRRILKRHRPDPGLSVLIHVPSERRYSRDVDPESLSSIKSLMPMVSREVLNGNYWLALTLNGLFYSSAFGCDAAPARAALEMGALAAGISGKGPATAAIVSKARLVNVLDSWGSYSGRVICTSLNYKTARVTGVPE